MAMITMLRTTTRTLPRMVTNMIVEIMHMNRPMAGKMGITKIDEAVIRARGSEETHHSKVATGRIVRGTPLKHRGLLHLTNVSPKRANLKVGTQLTHAFSTTDRDCSAQPYAIRWRRPVSVCFERTQDSLANVYPAPARTSSKYSSPGLVLYRVASSTMSSVMLFSNYAAIKTRQLSRLR